MRIRDTTIQMNSVDIIITGSTAAIRNLWTMLLNQDLFLAVGKPGGNQTSQVSKKYQKWYSFQGFEAKCED